MSLDGMQYVTSEPNNTGDSRLLATIHDTGDIGVGTMKKSGKWSCELWAVADVRDFADELHAICDLAEGKEPGSTLEARQTAVE